MSKPLSVRKTIAAIREAMTHPPPKKGSDSRLYLAVYDLGRQVPEIITDETLLAEVLGITGEIAAFRGQGSQSAAKSISRLLSFMVMKLVEDLPDLGMTFDSFSSARIAVPSKEVSWNALEKLAVRAFDCVTGPPSRSRHTSGLRADAWSQLGEISQVVRDPAYLAFALKMAGDTRAPLDERQAAVEFLPVFWGVDDPDEATATLLGELEKEQTDRTFLVAVLQVQIEMGLNDEFGAMFAVDEWDDANEEE